LEGYAYKNPGRISSIIINLHHEEPLEIHLQLYSILREKLPTDARGRAVLQLNEGATLDDVLKELGIRRRVVISVNGTHEDDRSQRLRDGDEVKIFSSVSGG
jgi:molybdopterin converting factor small subunit